jgi:hypothetical protein
MRSVVAVKRGADASAWRLRLVAVNASTGPINRDAAPL